MKKKLFQEADCTIDAFNYFNEQMIKETGLVLSEFKFEAERSLSEDCRCIMWKYKNYVLEYYIKDPFYILYKEEDDGKN
jgi:hypothetical protein